MADPANRVFGCYAFFSDPLQKSIAMNHRNLGVTVECYSGYRGDEAPRRFIMGKKTVEISEILDRWLDPEHRYFKVRGEDNAVYILRHDVTAGHWELIMFNSGTHEATRLSSS